MDSIKLSSKGQVIIPKHIRSSYHWETGQELIVIDTGDGILLKPKAPFSESTLSEVAGCPTIQEQPKQLTKWIVRLPKVSRLNSMIAINTCEVLAP